MEERRGRLFDRLMVLLFPPSDLDLDDVKAHGLFSPIVFCHVLVFAGLLLGFCSSNYQAEMGKAFLSLSGNSSSQTCWEVPRTVTGLFTADKRGYWSTSPEARVNESIFSLLFSGTSITTDQYKMTMNAFAGRLEKVGTKQSRRDLMWSAVAWSSLHFSDHSTNMAFSTNAQPAVIVQGSTLWYEAAWKQWKTCKDSVPRIQFAEDNKVVVIEWPISWPGWIPNPANETKFVTNTDFTQSCDAVCGKLGYSCPAKYTFLNNLFRYSQLPQALQGLNPPSELGITLSKPPPSPACITAFGKDCVLTRRYVTDGPIVVNGKLTTIFPQLHLPNNTVTCDALSSYTSPTGLTGASALSRDIGLAQGGGVAFQVCPCADNFTQPCAGNFDIVEDFGYSTFTKGMAPGKFSMTFDVRSLFVAIGVNYGVVRLSDLQRVEYPFFDTFIRRYLNTPTLPPVMFFVHPKFVPLTPIACFDREWVMEISDYRASMPPGAFEFCLVIDTAQMGQSGFVPAFPVASGGSWSEKGDWTQCLCGEPPTPRTPAEQKKVAKICNNLEAKISLVFPAGKRGLPKYQNLIHFGVSVTAGLADQPEGDVSIFSSQFFKANMDKYCPYDPDTGRKACFAVELGLIKNQISNFLPFNNLGLDFSLLSTGATSYDYDVGANDQQGGFLKLPTLTCQNSLYHDEAWQRMINSPPVALIEPYFKCQSTQSAALISAFGSAAGTSSLLGAIALSLILGALVHWVNHGGIGQGIRLRTVKERLETKLSAHEKQIGEIFNLAVSSSTLGSSLSATVSASAASSSETSQVGEATKPSFDHSNGHATPAHSSRLSDSFFLDNPNHNPLRRNFSPQLHIPAPLHGHGHGNLKLGSGSGSRSGSGFVESGGGTDAISGNPRLGVAVELAKRQVDG